MRPDKVTRVLVHHRRDSSHSPRRRERDERAGAVLAAAPAHGSFRSRHRTEAGHSRLAWRRQPPVALQGGPDTRCQPSIKVIPERPFWGVGERSRAGSPVSVARDPAPRPLAWVDNRPQKVQVLDPRRLVPLLKLAVVHYVVRLRSPEPVAQLVASIEVRQLEPGPELQPRVVVLEDQPGGGFLVAPGSGRGWLIRPPESSQVQAGMPGGQLPPSWSAYRSV